jgi:PAS domain S-box-containing protein
MRAGNETIRVLIIDDDEDDFLIISDYIKTIDANRFKIDWCATYHEAVNRIAKKEHDIYFVDYRLGAKTGLDLLRDAEALKCEEPIILLTGFGNPAVDNEAMRIGAMDYLIKSELNTEKLERCIRYSLERAAAVKALRANEQKYRNIFERSKDAVFITDKDLYFKDVNFATSQLLECEIDELTKINLCSLIDDSTVIKKIKESLSTTGEIIDLEVVLATSQSEEKKHCILSASRQTETTGESYVQGILHDITNLRKAERATLYAEKLAAAGRFVRTLAHEVRNPLNNVQMALEQLNTNVIPEDDKIFLEIIQRNSKRIDNLIAELLDSYRPYDKSFKTTNLQTILDESIQIAYDAIRLKGIQISSSYPDNPCIIQADPEKLKIAFLNIIVNATEAISADGFVEVQLQEKNDSYIVEISDNGCGIPVEIQSKLFEPYFTSKRNGMGLGLASTLNIVQSHGGTIDVRSEVNSGSTFSVVFPKAQDNLNNLSFK